MVVFQNAGVLGEAEGSGELHLVFRLVLPVPALPLGCDELRLRQGLLPCQLTHIVHDAVFIAVVPNLKLSVLFQPQPEGDPCVHHRLAVEHIVKIIIGNGNIGEYFQVRLPADGGAGLFPIGRFHDQLLSLFAADLAFFEVERILVPVPADGDVHILGGVLGGTGAQAVQAQGVLIVPAVGVLVLAAGIQLAEHQLPVIALLIGVPVHRAAAAKVLHLNGVILIIGEGDQVAMSLSCLIDGVGKNLKNGMFTSVQAVRTEDDPRPFSDPVRPFQLGYAVVSVLCAAAHICLTFQILYLVHSHPILTNIL